MSNNLNDDDQFLVLFLGTKRNTEPSNSFGTTLVGILTIAIVLMIVVALLNDVERNRRQFQPVQPDYATRRESWNRCQWRGRC